MTFIKIKQLKSILNIINNHFITMIIHHFPSKIIKIKVFIIILLTIYTINLNYKILTSHLEKNA